LIGERVQRQDPPTGKIKQVMLGFAYPPRIGATDGPYNLPDGYQQRAIEVAHAQAAVARARLAGLLNAALAGP
jgi:hypothetical protein